MKNNKYLVFVGMGFELVGLILASVYFGGRLDAAYGLHGLGVVVPMIAVLVGWLIHIIFLVKQLDKKEDE